jgi:hypothetical protein
MGKGKKWIKPGSVAKKLCVNGEGEKMDKTRKCSKKTVRLIVRTTVAENLCVAKIVQVWCIWLFCHSSIDLSTMEHPTHAMMILEKSVEQNGQVIEIFKAKEHANSTMLEILRERFGKDQQELDFTKTKVEKLEEVISDLKLENLQHLQQIEKLQKELVDHEMYIKWGNKLKDGNHHLTKIRIDKGICELNDSVSDSHYVYFQEKKKPQNQEYGARKRRKAPWRKPYDRPAKDVSLSPLVSEPIVLYSEESS